MKLCMSRDRTRCVYEVTRVGSPVWFAWLALMCVCVCVPWLFFAKPSPQTARVTSWTSSPTNKLNPVHQSLFALWEFASSWKPLVKRTIFPLLWIRELERGGTNTLVVIYWHFGDKWNEKQRFLLMGIQSCQAQVTQETQEPLITDSHWFGCHLLASHNTLTADFYVLCKSRG